MTQPVPAPSPEDPNVTVPGADAGRKMRLVANRNVCQVLAEILPILHSHNESDDLLLTEADRIDAASGLLALRNAIDALTVTHLNTLDTDDAIFHEIGVSTRTWLADHERLTPPQATTLLKQGQNLAQFAGIKQAALTGNVSLAQAMAIGSGLANLPMEVEPHQIDDAEAHLVSQAAGFNSKDLGKLSAKVLEVIAPDTADELAEQQLQRNLDRAHRERHLKFSDDGHGTTRISGSLPTMQARAVETVLGAFAADEHRRSIDNLDPYQALTSRPQRLADALVTVCERIEHCGEAPHYGGDRPRIVVTIDHAQLLDWNDSTGAREIGVDHRLTPEELRQLACDADLLPVVLGGDGEILDVGRDHRLVTPAIRAALTVRDRGCIFPGCDRLPVDCEAHHLQPGRPTGPPACRTWCCCAGTTTAPSNRPRTRSTDPDNGRLNFIRRPESRRLFRRPTSIRSAGLDCTTGSSSDGEGVGGNGAAPEIVSPRLHRCPLLSLGAVRWPQVILTSVHPLVGYSRKGPARIGVRHALPRKQNQLRNPAGERDAPKQMRHAASMYFVGLDLAWGTRSPTGVAVLDEGGVLRHLSAQRSDADITAALAPYAAEGMLAGVDAPLIVTNESGSRPAEKALNRDFSRFDAGAHPANTANPALGEVTRGARLCAALGLEMDPDAKAGGRAIEVYPHPATISLFRLGRTLKYKNKPGRTLEQLRGEMLVLMRLLESLATAQPALQLVSHDGWRDLVSAVENAGRKAELRRAEDQVDAVVCAYVALFRERRPEAVTTYGDFASGFIVTPTLPEGLNPSPRLPRTQGHLDVVRRATREYAAEHPGLVSAAKQAVEFVTGILDDAGLNYLNVSGRAKSVASFAEKAGRMSKGAVMYPDPIGQISDVIGLRVVTYVLGDVALVAELLGTEAVILSDRDMGQETAREGQFGYVSRHLQIRLSAEDRERHPAIGDRQVQVQIRTVLQHAWAEFEHDIRYKGTIPEEHRSDFDRRFTLAAGLLELADREFSTIRERMTSESPDVEVSEDDGDPRISPRELAAFLAGQYADANWSRRDHYAWIAGLVLELGITSLSELAEVIRGVDAEAISRRMGYRNPTGAVRRLDDALLVTHGDAYINLHGNEHRVDRLRRRLAKMVPGH